MLSTVRQYAHIRGRTCISCHAKPAYLPMPPSAPRGPVSAGLPLTLFSVCVWVCAASANDLVSPTPATAAFYIHGSVLKSMALLLPRVCTSPIPSLVDFILSNQTFRCTLCYHLCHFHFSHTLLPLIQTLFACLTGYMVTVVRSVASGFDSWSIRPLQYWLDTEWVRIQLSATSSSQLGNFPLLILL